MTHEKKHTDYPKGERYYKEAHRLLGYNYDKLKAERNELLEALEELVRAVNTGSGDLDTMHDAEALIAKARGESC